MYSRLTTNLLVYSGTLILLMLTGCVPPHADPPRLPEINTSQRDYVDLKPGWRVRVVFPILRSGGYLPAMKEQPSGNGTALSTTDDFLGYERSYYKVSPREGDGIRIDFLEAQIWEKGKFHSQPKTRLPLFDAIADKSYVRLVYLIRASQADHNMALVAASDARTLDAITQQVTSTASCQPSDGGVCAWVPAGVAVTPEEKRVIEGKRQWTNAR